MSTKKKSLLVAVALVVWQVVAYGLSALAGDNDLTVPASVIFVFWPLAAGLVFLGLLNDYSQRYGYTPDDLKMKERETLKQWRFWLPGWTTSVVLAYYLLPIWMNLLSKLTTKIGWAKLAQIFFEYRYFSWLAVVLLFLLGASASYYAHTKEWLKNI